MVTDNLHRHQSASVGRCVAHHDGIKDELGQKEQRGLRTSLATRATVLADPTPRLVLHETPTQAAWMHQIARWCSSGVRKWLTRARVPSVAALEARIVAFIAYVHATRAQPFQWTSGRTPLSV